MCFAGLGVVLVRLALGFDVVWVLWVGCSFVWLLLGDFAGCRILGRVVWGLQAWVIWVCVLRLTGICGRLSLCGCASQVLGGFVGLGC